MTAEKVGRGATAKRVKTELSPKTALKIAKVAEANGQSMGEAVASLLAKSVGHAAAGTTRRTRTGRARQQGRVGRSTTPTKSRQSQGVRFSVALTERENKKGNKQMSLKILCCPSFTDDEIKAIDKTAKRLGVTREEFVRRAVSLFASNISSARYGIMSVVASEGATSCE